MTLRERARGFLVMATHGETGRRKYDPIFEAVTEGRQRESYSGCGDLAHWLLYRLGFRFDWVNRKEHQGWRVGYNVSLLSTGAVGGLNRYAKRPERGMLVDSGDVLVVYARQCTKTHVAVVMAPGELDDGSKLETAEYGQFDATYGRASGRSFHRSVSANATSLLLGSAPVDSILSLEGLAAKDEAHVQEDGPVVYFEDIASRQRVLRLTEPRMWGNDIRWLCEELRTKGYQVGRPIDVFGRAAEKAIKEWQQTVGLTAEGVANGKVEPDEWCELLDWREAN